MRDRAIVCVGFNDWETDLQTNQHHLMARLAATNDVLFIESLGLRRPQLAGRDLKRIVRRLITGVQAPRRVQTAFGALRVLSPLVLPYGLPGARAVNPRLLPALVRRAARQMERPILWGYVPQAEVLLDALDPALVVYHCVDDIAAQDGIDSAAFAAAEERFARRADLVLCSAPKLAERMRAFNANVLYAPNVADVDAFAAALDDGPRDAALEALPAPRIVFTGAIAAKKLDYDLLIGLARARRDWSIALVGPVGIGDPGTDVGPLGAEPNLHLLGRRDYADLPAVLRGADVALIPYRRTQLTASIFPMKVYEYLAAGLPVVATPLEALDGVEGITFAADAAQTAAAVADALATDSPTARAARSALAAGHSWDARLAEITTAIEAL